MICFFFKDYLSFQRIDNLRRAYKSVEDIDLFIGAIQELATEEVQLGILIRYLANLVLVWLYL